MDTVVTAPPPELPVAGQCNLRLPLGLLGFERFKDYVLLADPAEDPFMWLQVVNDPTLAFLVLSPLPLFPEYKPEITEDDVKFLGLQSDADTAVLSIVTLRGPNEATVNLKGPIVVNRRTLVAKQVIPANASTFSVQHPLPVAQP